MKDLLYLPDAGTFENNSHPIPKGQFQGFAPNLLACIGSPEDRKTLLSTTKNNFHIGPGPQLSNSKAYKIVCNKCGCSKFEVAVEAFYTAVRCPSCGYEVCIHSG